MSKYEEQKMKFLSRKEEFRDFILKLRKKWKIPSKGFTSLNKAKRWEDKVFENDQSDDFNRDFEKIFIKFKIQRHFASWIHDHLIFNLIADTPLIQKNLIISTKPDERDKTKIRIFVEIIADTKESDIKNAFSYIKELQKSTFGYNYKCRKRFKSYLDRDLFIYDLAKKGKSHNEIREIIKNKNGCNGIYVDDISKIIAKIKKKIEDC